MGLVIWSGVVKLDTVEASLFHMGSRRGSPTALFSFPASEARWHRGVCSITLLV
jgi:hypothetical protein